MGQFLYGSYNGRGSLPRQTDRPVCSLPRRNGRIRRCGLIQSQTLRSPVMTKTLNSVVEAIGGTPLVRLDRLTCAAGVKGAILAKLDYLNPGFSKYPFGKSLSRWNRL